MPHREIVAEPRPPFYEVIAMFRIDSFSLHLGCSTPTGSISSSSFNFIPSRHATRMVGYLDQIAEAANSEAPGYLDYVRGLYMAYLALTLLELEVTVPPPLDMSPMVVRALALIETELGRQELCVKWMATRLACNPDYLARVFLRNCREPIIGYIQRRRIEYAREMLQHSTMNTAEVGWSVGFRHITYFNRVFRKLTNCTPSEYRRQLMAK